MGEVWLARHSLLRRDAAVKLILPELLERASHSERRHMQERFESEAQAISSLRSPHTVAIYDYGLAENGSLYYAMEYLHGVDAQTLVARYGPQPAGRVVSFLRQACESLEEAHDAGLIHRDIKPSNIFICRLGKRTDFVKVVDFGLVKQLARSTESALTNDGAISGTPAFMAPEQVRGEEVDARTDIYELGCLAYFLLTGTIVFDKPNPMATAVAHLNEPPTPPSTRSELAIPPSLERVVMACLEKSAKTGPSPWPSSGRCYMAAPRVRPGLNGRRPLVGATPAGAVSKGVMSGGAVNQRVQMRLLMVASALMMAHQVAGKASRDAIFLSQFGTAALPAMVAVATFTAVAASLVGSRMFVRLGPHRLAPASLALSGVVQIAEWFLLGYGGRIGAIAIYLHLAAFGALLLPPSGP